MNFMKVIINLCPRRKFRTGWYIYHVQILTNLEKVGAV